MPRLPRSHAQIESIATGRARLAVLLGCAAGLVLAAGAAHAQSVRWITDSLKLEARRGPSTEHKITHVLESGTRVTVLEENAESGYSRLRLEDGEEVWMLTRFLSDERPARERLEEALANLEQQREQTRRLTNELETLKAETAALQQERSDLDRDSQDLRRELAEIKQAAADTLTIREENKTQEARLATLSAELDDIRLQNRALKERSERDWFIAGAGVLFGGMVLGLIIPRIRWRRRKGWNEL